MDAIKKKMQAMKLEKDNAMDRADACEQQAKDANLRAERVRTPMKNQNDEKESVTNQYGCCNLQNMKCKIIIESAPGKC